MKISARDIDHLSLTLSDPEGAASKLAQLGFNLTPEGVEPRCICFQPDRDDIPNYIELIQGDPDVIALAMNVAELDGEERTHAWETEDGFEVAYRALRDGRPDDAIAGFRAVLARVPRHVPSWGNLGLAYRAAGRRREATRCWRRALKLDPGYALARDHLAGCTDAQTGRRLR